MSDVIVADADARILKQAEIVIKKKHKNANEFRLQSLNGVYSEFDLDFSKTEERPQRVILERFTNRNRTPEARGWVETLNISKAVTISRTIVFSKTIASTIDVSINGSVTFPGGTAGGSARFSRQVTIMNSNTFVENEVVISGNTRVINTTVAPFSLLEVELKRTIGTLRVPFKGNAVLDGVIEYRVYNDDDVYDPDRNTHTLKSSTKRLVISSLLNEAQRTFEVNGYVEDSEASGLEVEFRQYPIEGLKNLSLSTPTVIKDVQNESRSDLGDSLRDASDDLPYIVRLVEEEFMGSTYVQTGDVIANIEVRHLSMGPGFCNVNTQSDIGGSITTNAPPAFWSQWQVINAHIGKISTTLSVTVNCDTGVRSQVRYHQ